MITGANTVSGLGFSWTVLLTLVAVFIASVLVFYWQVRRWTTNRGWRALLDWARATGFTLSSQPRDVPAPFDRLPGSRVKTWLKSGHTVVFQLQTTAGSAVETPRWNVLVRELEAASWTPTGLRPVLAKASVLDQFSLSSFPGMGEVERFVIFGTDSSAARLLSRSEARALLPPDVGLLLAGNHLVLDFSTRPFDPIELGRMTALAEQLVTRLPASL
jgi:hypothetical protein